MKTIKSIKILLLILLVISFHSLISAEEIDPAKAYRDKITHAGFKKIQGFGHISVNILGAAIKLGISEKDLTDYARLKFINNFKDIKILNADEFAKLCDKQNSIKDIFYCTSEKIGYLNFKIYCAGDNYPIVFHINCRAGHLKNYPILEAGLACSPIIWEDAVLGYGSKEYTLDGFKKSINKLIEKLAIVFFKVKGEL